MICIRRHFFSDVQYKLYIENDLVLIGKNSSECKYIINIDLDQQLEWIYNKNQLKGFSIPTTSDKWKQFEMSPEDLNYLKLQLDGRVQFNNIEKLYRPVGVVGRGGSGKVIKVVNEITNEILSCKNLNLSNTTYDEIKEEARILSEMDHPNIIKLKSFYKSEKGYHILTELAEGGTLKKFLDAAPKLTKNTMRIIMKQILQAVAYVHSRGYAHRDIKPDNIMLMKPNDLGQLKLIDFGFASQIQEVSTKFPHCGTPGFMAPEIIQNTGRKPYDEKCDVFSCGVLFYRIVTGKSLFPGEQGDLVYKLNQKCEINFDNIPFLFRELLERMLEMDASNRITAETALAYLQNEKQSSVTIMSPCKQNSVAQSVRVISIKHLIK